jgi:hypothetical protein
MRERGCAGAPIPALRRQRPGPTLCPLFTRVRGRGVLGTSPLGGLSGVRKGLFAAESIIPCGGASTLRGPGPIGPARSGPWPHHPYKATPRKICYNCIYYRVNLSRCRRAASCALSSLGPATFQPHSACTWAGRIHAYAPRLDTAPLLLPGRVGPGRGRPASPGADTFVAVFSAQGASKEGILAATTPAARVLSLPQE